MKRIKLEARDAETAAGGLDDEDNALYQLLRNAGESAPRWDTPCYFWVNDAQLKAICEELEVEPEDILVD